MGKKKSAFEWDGKVGNRAQLGGIETSVLDNGPARGVRVAWVNTGSGLRYKVVIDRALDITEAFFNQHSLAWLSHSGTVSPRPDANHDLEWLWSFGGGLVTTCGLTHVGPPESPLCGPNVRRGLHGRISNIPATVESIVQPDHVAGDLSMSLTATIKQSRVFGPNLELRRTISGTLGQPKIRIDDTVTNRGNQPGPHMILYHCNFGWPLVDEGAEIIWKGDFKSAGRDMDDEIFRSGHDYKKCLAPLSGHTGPGEAAAFIDAAADGHGICHVGIVNRKLNMALAVRYAKEQLPWLTNWQHWGPGEYVCALEPGTNPPIGQNKAKEQNKLIFIEPGQSRSYRLEFEVLTEQPQIDEFVKSAG